MTKFKMKCRHLQQEELQNSNAMKVEESKKIDPHNHDVNPSNVDRHKEAAIGSILRIIDAIKFEKDRLEKVASPCQLDNILYPPLSAAKKELKKWRGNEG